MARTSPLIAFFTIALLVAGAFAYHTTVTTIEIDDNPERTSERCRQYQGRGRLRSCEQYLRQQGRGSVLEMRGIDENQRQEFDECCRQLREVDEQCRCEMLRDIVREMQQHGGGQEGRQMMQRARNLPSMCRMRPQRCQF